MPGLRYSTPQGDKTLPLGEKFTLGRDAESDLPLPHDKLASHQHACIRHEDDAYFVEDLHSTNGTFLLREGDDKFRRITSPQQLLPNDIIRVGSTRLVFDMDVAADKDRDRPGVGPERDVPPEDGSVTVLGKEGQTIQGAVIPPYFPALQEAQRRIDELEQQVAELKAQLPKKQGEG
jgi:pSer/pThr/pTyr-binding forkhead associated (FHA) protein